MLLQNAVFGKIHTIACRTVIEFQRSSVSQKICIVFLPCWSLMICWRKNIMKPWLISHYVCLSLNWLFLETWWFEKKIFLFFILIFTLLIGIFWIFFLYTGFSGYFIPKESGITQRLISVHFMWILEKKRDNWSSLSPQN